MSSVLAPRITASGTWPSITVNIVSAGGSGGEGTSDHRLLTHRDAPDQHPIAAVTDLATALAALGAAIPDVSGFVTADELGTAAFVNRGAPNGVASLDGSGTLPDSQVPASMARDTEVTAAVSAHNGSGGAHADIRALIDRLHQPRSELVVGAGGAPAVTLAIDSSWLDVEVRWLARSTIAGWSVAVMHFTLNGDTGANYGASWLTRDSTTRAGNTSGDNFGRAGQMPGSQSNTDRSASGTIKIADVLGARRMIRSTYASGQSSTSVVHTGRYGSEWASSAAVSSIQLFPEGGTFAEGSVFTLHARKATP